MKYIFLFFIAILLLISCLNNTYAQQSILSAGGEATDITGSVSYSIGQVAYITMTGTGGTVTEGVQQPYEILFNGIYDEPGISLECLIYPNPATVSVRLKIDNHEIQNLSYCLYSMNGLVVKEEAIKNKETIIPMDDMISGTYLLTVSEYNQTVTFFKIIKK